MQSWREFFSQFKSQALVLPALGVVYGDIGTSPLYAFGQSMVGIHPSAQHVEGILSLIVWTLVLVICVKYLLLVFKADNEGEGGIIALASCLKPYLKGTSAKILLFMMLLGVGLILGDGIITPAISVLSAVEGLHLLSPRLSYIVIPMTLTILLWLFYFQKKELAK